MEKVWKKRDDWCFFFEEQKGERRWESERVSEMEEIENGEKIKRKEIEDTERECKGEERTKKDGEGGEKRESEMEEIEKGEKDEREKRWKIQRENVREKRGQKRMERVGKKEEVKWKR